MRHSVQALAQAMLAPAVSLQELRTSDEVQRTAAGLLAAVIGSDELLHTRLDLEGPGTVVRAGPHLLPEPEMTVALSNFGHLHPAVASYLRPGDDRRPRRVSDIISSRIWWSSIAYEETFSSRTARYQLSLVTDLRPGLGNGWVLTRSARDFSDDDVDAAALLLPLLTVMEGLAATKPEVPEEPPLRLTPREQAVLELLATGSSAHRIGRALGITETTARKHLAHIYAKLGVHDRLSAVLCLESRREQR